MNATRKFVVVRHGSNAANQPMTPRLAVGIVEAASEEDARKEAEEQFNCYANQHLEILTEEEASSEDWNEACEEQERQSLEQASTGC